MDDKTTREEWYKALAEWSKNLSEADFSDQLAFHAQQVGIDGAQTFRFDGRWHGADAAENAYKGKVKYVCEWRMNKDHDVRYPSATFYTYKHGGESSSYNGYDDVVELFGRGHIPKPSPTKPKPTIDREPDYKRNRKRLMEIWNASVPLANPKAAPVREYLKYRGLGELLDGDLPKTLRCHPRLAYWDSSGGKLEVIGRYPAMIAAIQAPGDKVVSLHRTYLQPDGRGKAAVPSAKKIMPPAAPNGLRGAAIRLQPANNMLAVSEGIETALAIYVSTGMHCWAAISAHGMQSLEVPSNVEEVIICADKDESGAGQKAAIALAARVQKQAKQAKIAMPPEIGLDWLDVLNSEVTA